MKTILKGNKGKVTQGIATLSIAFGLLIGGSVAASATSMDPLGNNTPTQESTTVSPQQNTNDNAPSGEDVQNQLNNLGNDPNTPGTAEDPSGVNNSIGGDFIRNYQPMSDFDPTDSAIANMILNGVGKLTSVLIWLVVAFFFFVTACDFMYILVPFTRSWLADANEDGQGNSMGGGFGGGMGGMMGQANSSAQKKAIWNKQWVSDEAINAVRRKGGAAQSQMSGGMGGGVGGGGFGGGFGGGMGQMGMAPDQEDNTTQTVIGFYMKARIRVAVMFGIAIVLLTGSTLMGFGMDIGTWLLKLISALIAKAQGINIDFGA